MLLTGKILEKVVQCRSNISQNWTASTSIPGVYVLSLSSCDGWLITPVIYIACQSELSHAFKIQFRLNPLKNPTPGSAVDCVCIVWLFRKSRCLPVLPLDWIPIKSSRNRKKLIPLCTRDPLQSWFRHYVDVFVIIYSWPLFTTGHWQIYILTVPKSGSPWIVPSTSCTVSALELILHAKQTQRKVVKWRAIIGPHAVLAGCAQYWFVHLLGSDVAQLRTFPYPLDDVLYCMLRINSGDRVSQNVMKCANSDAQF